VFVGRQWPPTVRFIGGGGGIGSPIELVKNRSRRLAVSETRCDEVGTGPTMPERSGTSVRYRDVLCACFELRGVTVYTLRGRSGYVCRGEYERWA